MWLLDFFKKKEAPKTKWVSLSNFFNVDYKVNKEVFYKFYKRNPYIMSVINKIKTDIWWHGIELQKKVWKDKWETVWDEELVNLISYQTPWKKLSLKKFLSSIVKDVEICWNAYVYLARENWKIIWIKRVDPRTIIPIVKDTWEILWYAQNQDWIRYFLPDEMFHYMDDIDVDDEKYWESKMISLFLNLETDQEARESNLAFFKNNQTPSSIVLIDDEFEFNEEWWWQNTLLNEIKSFFNSWEHQGGKNKHRTAILQWVKEIIKVQDKITDMEFVELTKLTRETVCMVYSTPLDVLWITENSNRSVGETQSSVYWDYIAIKENEYEEFLTAIINLVLGKHYKVEILQDSIRQLAQKSKIAIELYKSTLVTKNEWREIIQYEKRQDGEVYYSWNEGKEKETTL